MSKQTKKSINIYVYRVKQPISDFYDNVAIRNRFIHTQTQEKQKINKTEKIN